MNRREFLNETALATSAALLGVRPSPVAAAEPPPETTTLRLFKTGSICWAAQYVAEELLHDEGFAQVMYPNIPAGGPVSQHLAAGEADVSMNFIAPNLIRLELGDPVVFLAGAHVGCFELVGTDRVRQIRDLRGKTAAVESLGGPEHVFLASIAAYVGLDPQKDIKWSTQPAIESVRLLTEGKVDAFLGFPPQAQELRARKIGHVVVNSATDRPWSQYFCCLVTASREFVRKNPVATKRALRAILKSADVCASEPERAARALVAKGYTPRFEYALQVMKELPYGKWREFDPEDTIRFYALRLHEAGMIKSSPQKIIAQGTDWRFLNELKKELKA
jgi:NitT/TauT family transport system substrate-binding protein